MINYTKRKFRRCCSRKQFQAIGCNIRYGSRSAFSSFPNASAKSFAPEQGRLSVSVSGASKIPVDFFASYVYCVYISELFYNTGLTVHA